MNFSESDYGQNARNNENRSILFHNLHEHQELQDITNMCRICASISGQVCPIFDEQCDDLAGKINKYLPIEVSCEDGLPQVICEQCQSTLVAWDELVKCCVQANGVLQQKLSVIRLLDPDKKKQEERAKSIESPTQNGQTLICVKIENESIDKTTELDKLCNQKESIDKPRKTVTKDGKRYSVCDICNKNIAIASWSRHSQSHSSVKRYSCHICGLGFNDSGNLSRHRRAVHAHQRPHACHICDRSFSRNSHLKEHIKTHSENRDYICDMCGKASKSSAALRMHRKTHASEYRFRCIYCESKFKRRSELVIHVSVHTGEKSHVCGCGKAFRLRNQLRNHTRTHIKEIQSITQQLE